jgi:hypothetical protein
MTPDPRLVQLITQGFRCAGCGEHHNALFDLAFDRPDPWPAPLPDTGPGPQDNAPNRDLSAALAAGRDILTEDFCVMGEHRFIRAILPLPIQGAGEDFAFGVWGSLSQPRFDTYVAGFDDPSGGDLTPAFSWLCNRLPGATDASVKAVLTPQPDRQRPILRITDETHPFFLAQTDGLSFDALLAIYRGYGHEPLPH